MHDPDAPPRLRWRIALWGIVVLVLTPVLYVAAVGPLHWWHSYHIRDTKGFEGYYRSLVPLYQSPPIAKWLGDYSEWWRARPAPRSWQRARIVGEIAEMKEAIETTYLLEGKHKADPVMYKKALEYLNWSGAAANRPSSQDLRRVYQAQLHAAEQRLRWYDAQ